MAEWITVSMASRQAGIAERTVRHWIAEGKLIAKKEKGRWLIDSDSLADVGKTIANGSAISAKRELVMISIERYEGLITRLSQTETRLAQLEAENSQYKLMLESAEMKRERRGSWWSRLFRKSSDESN